MHGLRTFSAKASGEPSRTTPLPPDVYHTSFHPSTDFPAYTEKYSDLETGARLDGTVVRLAGRVVARRKASSKLVFYDVNDGRGNIVQVLAEQKYYARHLNSDEESKEAFKSTAGLIRRGDVIGVVGFPGKSGKGELSIIPEEIKLLAPCHKNVPRSRIGVQDPEIRFRHRYLDMLVNPGVVEVFERRANVMKAIRRYFESRGFVEVETPIMYSSAGGALATPFKTHARAFDTELQLRIAPELFLKQLVVGGMNKVFELGKVFRNEGIDQTHNPEFTSCEFYEAYADLEDLMQTTEELLHDVCLTVTGESSIPIPQASDNDEDGEQSLEAPRIDFTPPYRRVSIIPALEEKLGDTLPDANDPKSVPQWLRILEKRGFDTSPPHVPHKLLDRLVGELLEPECIQPTFLCDHPTAMSPLAKAYYDRPGFSQRFELFVNGRELCNAYNELNDPQEQQSRFAGQDLMRAQGDPEAHKADTVFCNALEYGLPPTGGWGMGVDRLVMLLTGKTSIREVVTFPVVKPTQQ